MDLGLKNKVVLVTGAGSQKAFLLPPGLAFLSVSDKAWKNVEAAPAPLFYLDLKAYRKSVAKNDTPWTPAVSLIRGLKVSLDMIHAVGMETHMRSSTAVTYSVSVPPSECPAHAMRSGSTSDRETK